MHATKQDCWRSMQCICSETRRLTKRKKPRTAKKPKAKSKAPPSQTEDGAPIYNGVGVVKRHEWFCEPGAESRAVRRCCRTVHRRPLTPRMARQNSHATKPTGLRLEQDLFVRSRPRLAFESCGGR